MIKFCFCTVFVLFITAAHANSQAECLELHVISNSPIGFENSDKENVGVHWEYLTALEKATDFCINKTLLPYARIWQSIEHGKHDGGIVFKSDSRSNFIEYVAPIRTVKTVVIPVNGIKIRSYDDLTDLTIGKTRGTHLSKKFDHDASLKLIELNNYDQAAQMLKLGRIDAIAGSALVLSYQLRKYDVLDKVNLTNKLILGEKEQWLQLSKQSKHLDKIPELKQAIEQLQQNGRFDLIMDKYYGKRWKQINH